MATKAEREKFVSGVGWREIAQAFDAIVPGFELLNRVWNAAKEEDLVAFAKERRNEISTLAKAPAPATTSERTENAMPADANPDDDPLAIPTFLRRGHPDCVVRISK
jgi:hypothetical protein